MRILHVGNLHDFKSANEYYRTPQRLANGFTRLGHVVFSLNEHSYARYASFLRSRKHGARHVDAKFLQICDEFQPELVVLANCESISNRALEMVRERLKGCRLVYRNVDSLQMGGNLEKIRRRLDVVDALFITTHPRALDYSGRTRLAFLPNAVDASIDSGRAFAAPADDYDLFFAGHFVRDQVDTRPAFLAELSRRLSGLRLGFFGGAVGKPALVGARYIDTLARCRIGLSLDREDNHHLYASARMAHYLGSGLLTLVRSGKGFEEFFDETEVAWFADVEEAIAAVERYSADDALRRRVAEAGWRKAHAWFSVEKVADYMIEVAFGRRDPAEMRWGAA